MPMEKPTPINSTITLRITHPEKERYELCELSCDAGTTVETLRLTDGYWRATDTSTLDG